jgi:hypothetical protein
VPVHLPLAPELDEFRRQFEELSDGAVELAGTLTDEQYNWRPSQHAWSIGECIEHLNATARQYLPALDEGIADAIRRGVYGEGPFRYVWLGRLFVKVVEPPPRIRFRAARALVPPPRRPRQESVAAFRAYQVQYVDRLRQANGLDLARAYVKAPGSNWIRIQLGVGLLVTVAHERRHLYQATRVRQAPEFPP